MAKRQPMPAPQYEQIRDEAVHIATGETRYTIDLDEQTVEELERGICSEILAQRMHDLLEWRRTAIRAQILQDEDDDKDTKSSTRVDRTDGSTRRRTAATGKG